jgi:non-heme chloroperoxidase
MPQGLIMHRSLLAIATLAAALASPASAEPATKALGSDYVFASPIAGMPAKLSDFRDLQVNHFTTSDGVKLAYWEAGKGPTVVILPGWSSNGAEYIHVMWLLAKHHRVLVLDPRNQGLSQKVNYGTRIARYAADLREFQQAAKVTEADYIGHSMGATMIWSYIDLYGTKGMGKLVFIDEAISLMGGADWSEEDRRNAGAFADNFDQLKAALAPKADGSDLFSRLMKMDSPYFRNSQTFANAFIKNDMAYLALVMRDHAHNDWRDVITHKIDRPAAFFTGVLSANVPSQRWAASQIKDAKVFVYSEADYGDHLLAYKNPVKFVADLEGFLGR